VTVLVTGGAGRLGNAVVRALLDRGERVRVLDRAVDPASLEGLELERVVGSVIDRSCVESAVAGVDVVFHTAAKVDLGHDRDGSIRAVNVEGTRLVAQACLARGTRLVHTSSHAALDRRPFDEPLDEDKPLALRDPCDYHRSKAHGERVVLEMTARGLDATVTSPGTLTGPLDFEPSILGRALMDLRAEKIPILLDAVTDYADVRDVAAATVAAAERGERGERYLLTGDVLDMRQMARIVGDVTGRSMPRHALPLWVGWAMLPFTTLSSRLARKEPLYSAGMLRAAVSNTFVSHEKASRALGYAPRSLRTSMQDAFAFYEERGWL
jgi:dihydroflavonol-4-reductase